MWSYKTVVPSDIIVVFVCAEVIHDACIMMKSSKNVFFGMYPCFLSENYCF